MNEIWKDIIGYEGLYQVSNLGRVKSLNYKRTGLEYVLKPGTNGIGYLQVHLFKNRKRSPLYVHRLVAEAFVPNPKRLKTVNHKDENKLNNVCSNLEWMTSKDNVTYSQGKQVQMFDKQGNLLATFHSIKEASSITGVNHGHICECCIGKYKSSGGYIWRYV